MFWRNSARVTIELCMDGVNVTTTVDARILLSTSNRFVGNIIGLVVVGKHNITIKHTPSVGSEQTRFRARAYISSWDAPTTCGVPFPLSIPVNDHLGTVAECLSFDRGC